jgi:alkyldihydroxyacetonephosphate synthase
VSTIIEQLKTNIEVVSTDPLLLQERRHDYWVRSHLDDVQNRPAPNALCVVQPTTIEEVVHTVNCCREANVALIPIGLASGVCGGVIAQEHSVILDMGSMKEIRSIDKTNLLASFDAGKNGMEAEDAVQNHGLTIGHWPQSIAVSSVGGWVATRASGQYSTGYGNIEDIIHSVEAVLPDGSIIQAGKAPRAAAGPDLRQLLMGSEGTLGVISGVTFSLRKLPQKKRYTAFHVPDMAQGIEAQRYWIQNGYTPVAMRQYDAKESNRNFTEAAKENQGILFAIHEGPEELVEGEVEGITRYMKKEGFEAAPEEIVTGWLQHRNTVPTWASFLNNGIILDTIEISASWDTICDIYDTATNSLKEVPGIMAATAHSSHVYRSGINLYFTFAARPENKDDMASTYDECWKRVIEATAKHGGGVAHHHGIGRVRKPYLHHDLGDSGVDLLRTIKKALDPTGFMNPGVLIPDA